MENIEAGAQRIAIPCRDCPLLVGSDFAEAKVTFSPGGQISYQSTEERSCGINIVKATGERLEQVQKSILSCRGPEEYQARKPGILGRIGLTDTKRDCMALPFDPTSSRQATDFFEVRS